MWSQELIKFIENSQEAINNKDSIIIQHLVFGENGAPALEPVELSKVIFTIAYLFDLPIELVSTSKRGDYFIIYTKYRNSFTTTKTKCKIFEFEVNYDPYQTNWDPETIRAEVKEQAIKNISNKLGLQPEIATKLINKAVLLYEIT